MMTFSFSGGNCWVSSLHLLFVLTLQVYLLSLLISADKGDTHFDFSSNFANGERHSKNYCARFDICGERSDGKVLNCPYGSPAVKPDEPFSAKVQSLCPMISGNVCCTEAQFDTLLAQVQQASGNLTVDGIDFFVADTFAEGLYDSCKDVKFGTMNTRAIEFVGGDAKSFKGEWLAFIGLRADPGLPGSPYAINFQPSAPNSSGMEVMNLSIYSCCDTSLGCSCGDCPSASACLIPGPPSPPKSDSCLVKVGSLKIRCIDFSLSILYIVLVSAFLGWGFFHRTGERRSGSSMSSLNSLDGGEINHGFLPTDETKVPEMDSKRINSVQFSTIQFHMSCFFRRYGAWVARHPAIVLCSSLAVVLLLCVRLVRFEVETRPEKLWVGPGSKAAEEKPYFDRHLSPFYRIEQLILATIPNPRDGKSPIIVTEDNIQFLFEIQNKVDQLCANYSGTLVAPTDICLKPLGEDCATQTVLQYYQMDPDSFDDLGGVEHAEYCFQHFASAETCLSAFKGPLDPSTALGGFSGNNYSEASAFVITYPVNNAVNQVGDENGKAVAWEKAFIQLVKDELLPIVQSNNLSLSYSSESSIEEELKRESTEDIVTVLISYLVMFAYISITLGDTPHLSTFYLSSKVLLALSGVMVVVLSVLGSAGLFSAMGVKSTLIIMEIIPFLVLADIHAGILGMWIVKVIIIAAFAALSLASIALSTRIKPGLEQQVALPRDSYLQGYFHGIAEYLRNGPPVYFVITRASLTPETSYIAKLAASWLDDFLVWLSPEAFSCCRKFVNGSYCPPDDQPPCCSPDDDQSCGFSEVCKDCTTCFRHSDLKNDRPSTVQFREKLPWFLNALPSADCAKAGYGAYTSSVDLEGYESGVIKASEFRTYHTPLNKQDDYVSSLSAAREFASRVSKQLKIHVFPYSVFYIFFEQYLDIWGTALTNIAIALDEGFIARLVVRVCSSSVTLPYLHDCAVFLVCLVITSSLWSSAIILLVLAMILVDLLGVMAVLNIQLNAVSMVNLIMSIGIAVEFYVHISHAFLVSTGDREKRAQEALCTMGSSVFSEITLTKFVGVIVLYFAKSEMVYYFQMYLALVILGFLHGLVFLPVVLSIVGPPSRFVPIEAEEEVEALTSSSSR